MMPACGRMKRISGPMPQEKAGCLWRTIGGLVSARGIFPEMAADIDAWTSSFKSGLEALPSDCIWDFFDPSAAPPACARMLHGVIRDMMPKHFGDPSAALAGMLAAVASDDLHAARRYMQMCRTWLGKRANPEISACVDAFDLVLAEIEGKGGKGRFREAWNGRR